MRVSGILFLGIVLPFFVKAQKWNWAISNLPDTYMFYKIVLDNKLNTISFSIPNSKMYITKHDPEGNLIWTKEMLFNPPPMYETASGLAVGGFCVDKYDNIYLQTNNIRSLDGKPINTKSRLSLIKLNTNGQLIWANPIQYKYISTGWPSFKIEKGGDKLFLHTRFSAHSEFTYDGKTFSAGLGADECSFIASMDTSGHLLWGKTVTTRTRLACSGGGGGPTTFSVNDNRELFLSGQAGENLFINDTVVFDRPCKEFFYGLMLNGDDGTIKWLKEIAVDTAPLPRRKEIISRLFSYNYAVLANGNVLVYHSWQHDSTYKHGFQTGFYPVLLSNKLYLFDSNGNLLRAKESGSISNGWLRVSDIFVNETDGFYISGMYHEPFSNTDSENRIEIRRMNESLTDDWIRRLDYYFDWPEIWSDAFCYNKKMINTAFARSSASATYPCYIYFGKDSILISKNTRYLANLSDTTFATLSVSLMDLNAVYRKNNNVISWKTFRKDITTNFIIEHSRDGRVFSVIGSHTALGKLGAITGYSYTHFNPAEGRHYYRLKGMYKNGTFNFSKIVLVNVEGEKKAIKVSPNPLNSSLLRLQHTSFPQKVEVAIFNMSGLKIHTFNIDIGSTQTQVRLPSSYAGLYCLVARLPDGKSIKDFFFK